MEKGSKYVQDLIREQKEEFVPLLSDEKTTLFVCGDARNMARDVNDAIVECVAKVAGERSGVT